METWDKIFVLGMLFFSTACFGVVIGGIIWGVIGLRLLFGDCP